MEPSFFSQRSRSLGRRADGFTLIELLAVMTIILVLAGLILGIASHVQYKGSLTRAKTEVTGLGSAIENYKIDNGVYPQSDDTDKVNPLRDFDPSSGTLYKKSSAYLFQELSGQHLPAAGGNSTLTKSYFNFQPNQLEIAPEAPASVKLRTPTSPYMYIADPFGFSYGYSTSYLKSASDAVAAGNASSTPAPDQGYNPTYDLWSTAGYSPTGGRGTPTSGPNASPSAVYSTLWIKNW